MASSFAPKDKIIVAVDVADVEGADRLIRKLGARVGFYKIGLQLFTAAGPAIVGRVRASGAKVFLDLKFHDIPHTVRRAVESACALGVDMLTLHLCGGPEMAAAAAAGAGNSPALLLGVTVLTSSDRETLAATGVAGPVEDQVLRLAHIAADNGIGGIVASPREVRLLRQVFANSLKIVTPGIRPAWAADDDQKRVLTPADAITNGSDYLVIGRPITGSDDPAAAADRIAEEIAGACG